MRPHARAAGALPASAAAAPPPSQFTPQIHPLLITFFHHAALRLLGRPELAPWEVNTERSYYEEQVLSANKNHSGTEILIFEKAPPHESV